MILMGCKRSQDSLDNRYTSGIGMRKGVIMLWLIQMRKTSITIVLLFKWPVINIHVIPRPTHKRVRRLLIRILHRIITHNRCRKIFRKLRSAQLLFNQPSSFIHSKLKACMGGAIFIVTRILLRMHIHSFLRQNSQTISIMNWKKIWKIEGLLHFVRHILISLITKVLYTIVWYFSHLKHLSLSHIFASWILLLVLKGLQVMLKGLQVTLKVPYELQVMLRRTQQLLPT